MLRDRDLVVMNGGGWVVRGVVKSDVTLLLLQRGLLLLGSIAACTLSWSWLESFRRSFDVVDWHVRQVCRGATFVAEDTLNWRWLVISLMMSRSVVLLLILLRFVRRWSQLLLYLKSLVVLSGCCGGFRAQFRPGASILPTWYLSSWVKQLIEIEVFQDVLGFSSLFFLQSHSFLLWGNTFAD